jgi:3-phosphoshikimate 1-carboxyvinyltransferase
MGVAIETAAGGEPAGITAPLTLRGRPAGQRLRGLDYQLPVASAQVKSCLLLAALAADGPTRLSEPGPSRDHTERMLGGMGVPVTAGAPDRPGDPYLTRLDPPEGVLSPLGLRLPADISTAAFLIVAALVVPGSRLRLPGVGLNPTRTGLLDALKAMGADICVERVRETHGEPLADLTIEASRLHGVEVSGPLVVRMIDEFPVFAVAAACAEGQTVVRQAEELRYKESDRIAALCGELRRLGVKAEETSDGFVIQGGGIPGGAQAEAHGDHRLAMALAVAGLAAREPVSVQGAEICAESFPGFVSTLQGLGAVLLAAE